MSNLEPAARMALEALQLCANGEDDVLLTRDALASLRQALEHPANESVAVFELQDSGWEIIADGDWVMTLPMGTKLHTEPPKREWVGLNDVEIGDALIDLPVLGNGYFLRIARAIETALKDKNT